MTNVVERGERVSRSEDPRCDERRREKRESLERCDERRRERGERVSRSEVLTEGHESFEIQDVIKKPGVGSYRSSHS